MKNKVPKKHIYPRIVQKLDCDPNEPPGSEEMQRSAERMEQKLDEEFRGWFSASAMKKRYAAMAARLKKMGWKEEFELLFSKDDRYLTSELDVEGERDAIAAWDAFEMAEKLHKILLSASNGRVRALRIAFEAGALITVNHVYRTRAETTGRPGTRSKIFKAIGVAVKRWSQRPENAGKVLSASAVWPLYMHPAEGDFSKKSFQSRFSEWKKLPQNNSGEK